MYLCRHPSMTALGHLERFPPERLSGRCRIGQETSAGAYSGDGLAPMADLRTPRGRLSPGALATATATGHGLRAQGSSVGGGADLPLKRGSRHEGPPYSTTSSACMRIICGNDSPRFLAIVRLTVRWNRVGCSIGRSAGLAPWRIRATMSAARSEASARSTP